MSERDDDEIDHLRSEIRRCEVAIESGDSDPWWREDRDRFKQRLEALTQPQLGAKPLSPSDTKPGEYGEIERLRTDLSKAGYFLAERDARIIDLTARLAMAEREREQARAEVLEEAAKMAEAQYAGHGAELKTPRAHWYEHAGKRIATAIRSLKSKPPVTTLPEGVEGLVERLREKARTASDLSKAMAAAKSRRQTDNPEGRDDLYEWSTPEQMTEWKAADTIQALQAENDRLRSLLTSEEGVGLDG